MERHLNKIKPIDMNSIEFAAFHVTSNSDQCVKLKQHGIKNLQRVLLEPSEINLFLKSLGFQFDIQNKKMILNGKVYNIDYESYRNKKDALTLQEKKLFSIIQSLARYGRH